MANGSNRQNPPSEAEFPRAAAIRRDLLHENSKLAAAAMGLLAIALLAASIAAASPKELPEVAFGWGFGLVIFRAAAAFAVIAILAMVLIRGWGGLWPQGISTTGIDYAGLAEGSKELGQGEAKVRNLIAELQEVKALERSDHAQ